MTLAIDFGHGLPEKGIKHYTFSNHDDFTVDEWLVNRQIAKRVMNLLSTSCKTRVFDVVSGEFVDEKILLTHGLTEDNVSLNQRIRNVNEAHGITLMVSIHHNLLDSSNTGRGEGNNTSGAMFGIGTNAGSESERIAGVFAQTYRSHEIATNIHAKRIDESWAKWPERPASCLVKREWSMMTKTKMPAITTEIGFMSNYKDARFMSDTCTQGAESDFIFEAIKAALPREFTS